MRHPLVAARVAVTAAWLVTRTATASAQGAATPAPVPPSPSPSPLGRWLDVQQASLNIRYREQETNAGATAAQRRAMNSASALSMIT